MALFPNAINFLATKNNILNSLCARGVCVCTCVLMYVDALDCACMCRGQKLMLGLSLYHSLFFDRVSHGCIPVLSRLAGQ